MQNLFPVGPHSMLPAVVEEVFLVYLVKVAYQILKIHLEAQTY